MSTFSGLSTALSALYTHRRGLDLTGQNIANANTEGYSRQRLNLEAIGAPATPAFFSTYEGAGGGVTVADMQRLRDAFLESRGQTEHAKGHFLSVRSDALAGIEDVLAEPGDTGLQAQLSEFWNGWHDVANRPGDTAARSQLLQRASTLTDSLHQAHDALDRQWTATRTQLRTVVDEVNTAARNIAELNLAIRRDSQADIPSNELADRRDLLVMRLADLVGATTRGGEDGVLDVYVGGTALVRGSVSVELQVAGADVFDQTMATPPQQVVIEWKKDGYPATVTAGQAAGHLDSLNSTVPGYATRLDGFAADLATRVNTVHRTGFGMDGVDNRDFFTGTTAASITVAVATPEQLGASAFPAGARDGSRADQVAALAVDPNGPDGFYRQLVVDLGVDTQTAARRSQIQGDVTAKVDASRDAQSGVDLDEEMVNMLTFQRAYEGAARVMSSIDQALDTLINRTGLVGR
jgi:flagellar hook-associated protein 1 FlgK